MKCEECGVVSSDANKFCPNCGIDLSLNPLDRYLAAQLPERVKIEVAALLKDQKVVEVEIAEAVATRLSAWGKLAGYFLGTCVAALVLALSLVGIKSAADLRDLGKSVEKDVASKFEKEIASKYQESAEKVSHELEAKFRKETETQVIDVKKKAESLLADYEHLKTQLSQMNRSLTERVDTIEKKVDRFKIQTSNVVPDVIRLQLEDDLAKYQKHLLSLGYQPEMGGDVSVEIRPKSSEGFLAYYDDSTNVIVVNGELAKEMDLTDLVLREYGHRVMLSMNNYDRGNEADRNAPAVAVTRSRQPELLADDANRIAPVMAVQSGMVTFLVCSFRGKSFYGKSGSDSPLSDELTKKHKVSEIKPGIQWASIDGSSAWGSLFWAIREDIGQEATERSLLAAWKGWKIGEKLSISDFAKNVLSEVQENSDEEAATRIREMMIQWGIELK